MNAKAKPNEEASKRWSIRSLFGAHSKASPEAAAAKPEPAPEPALPANARKILVVDDDEVICKSTAMKLRAHGFAVTTATDGPSAIHAARSEHPDLIVLDLNFPPDISMTWDGFSILNWLRRLEATRNVPVVILTGQQGNAPYERARSAGVAGFFHKPLDFGP